MLAKKIPEEKMVAAYNYLKKVRYEDRRPGTVIDEHNVMHELRQMIADADIRFEVEHLLFLEMTS